MRFLFVSAQLTGHLDWGGYLRTAMELTRRGHTVLWASGAEVAAQVRAAHVPFHTLTDTGWRWPPPPPLKPDPRLTPEALQQARQERSLDQWLDVERVARATDELIALCRDFAPDRIVSEMFTAAAGIAAEAVDAPLAIAGWPAPQERDLPPDPFTVYARARIDALLARFKVQGRYFTKTGLPALRSPLLHITYWSASWFGQDAEQPPTRHVGGIAPTPAPPDPTLPASPFGPDDKTWVLITLGTSFNVDPVFFGLATQAAARLGCVPVAAMGAPLETPWVQQARELMPESAVLRERVEFRATLPYAAAAIHHGGAGTTHALITHGIPQIVVPHAADQTRQAQGVARTGIGLWMPAKQATVEGFVDGLARLLPDLSPVRAAAQRLQAEFAALGGPPAAADLLESIVN